MPPLKKYVDPSLIARMDTLEGELSKKFSELFQPISEKLERLNKNIQQATQLANGAMNLCLAQQEDMKALQSKDTELLEKIVITNNRHRFFNLKFRGIPESTEKPGDILAFMSGWLPTLLQPDAVHILTITQAYRLGKLNPKNPLPRDVVVTFIDIRGKNALLQLAREHGYFKLQAARIQVFPDLAPEALAKRKELKGIIASLNDAKIRFHWITPLRLKVFYNKDSYTVSTEEEGLELLQKFQLPLPPRQDRMGVKRKINLLSTPLKDPKKQAPTAPV